MKILTTPQNITPKQVTVTTEKGATRTLHVRPGQTLVVKDKELEAILALYPDQANLFVFNDMTAARMFSAVRDHIKGQQLAGAAKLAPISVEKTDDVVPSETVPDGDVEKVEKTEEPVAPKQSFKPNKKSK